MKGLAFSALYFLFLTTSLWAQDKSVEELFQEASSAELQYEDLREPAVEELVHRGEEAVPYLVGRLGTRDARERHALENILKRIKEPAVEPLIEALKTNDRWALSLGIRILGLIGDKRALPPLLELSFHPNWRVRSTVAFSLGRIGENTATPWLISALEDSVDLVRKSAAVSLGELKDPRAMPQLLQALFDSFYGVRYSAAGALAKLGSSAIDSLICILQVPSDKRRYLAIEVLGEIGDQAAIKSIIPLLDDADWATRAFAALAIGRLRGKEGIEALIFAQRKERHPYALHQIRETLKNLAPLVR